MKNFLITGLLIICLLTATGAPTAYALDFKDVLKFGGVAIAVKSLSGPLNDFINTLTAKNGVGTRYSTKVVPIVSLGNGGYIGSAQVTGSKSLVEKTKAVVQVEGNFSHNNFRVKALIPSDTENPLKFSRVDGVGVSAIIDLRI